MFSSKSNGIEEKKFFFAPSSTAPIPVKIPSPFRSLKQLHTFRYCERGIPAEFVFRVLLTLKHSVHTSTNSLLTIRFFLKRLKNVISQMCSCCQGGRAYVRISKKEEEREGKKSCKRRNTLPPST